MRMISRRVLIGRATTAAALGPGRASAQTPKRGGTLSIRLWDPPHWDPYLTLAFRTQVPYTFTHSRLLRHKAGPGTLPGTFEYEGDLAESWTQPDERTYVSSCGRRTSCIRWARDLAGHQPPGRISGTITVAV